MPDTERILVAVREWIGKAEEDLLSAILLSKAGERRPTERDILGAVQRIRTRGNRGAIGRRSEIHIGNCNKRARVPFDFSTDTAFESKETNSSAPSQFPS